MVELGPWAGPYEIVARRRPIEPVSALPHGDVPVAPYLAVTSTRARAELRSGADAVIAELVDGELSLRVGERRFRSRRSATVSGRPDRIALTLTGWHAVALAHVEGTWTAHAKLDLRTVGIDPHDEQWLAAARDADGEQPAGFGQLGLRDLRLVTTTAGERYSEDIYLSATSAGPGFFDTAHTSIWRLDPATYDLTHTADLFFRRPGQPGVFGDHATHVVRDGERWLVATSTWGDFELRRGHTPSLSVTLAETTRDVLHGVHVLDTRAVRLPPPPGSVGIWDPHLARTPQGWLVGYVSARRFFDFAPAVATGPTLDDLTLRASASGRRATEGTTLWRAEDRWWVLASDGPDSARSIRRRHPVFDLDLVEQGTLRTPYPTNIPWPTLVPTAEGGHLLVTFDGTSTAGRVAGYGSHGDVVIARRVTD